MGKQLSPVQRRDRPVGRGSQKAVETITFAGLLNTARMAVRPALQSTLYTTALCSALRYGHKIEPEELVHPKATQLAKAMLSFNCYLDTLGKSPGKGVSISNGTV